VTWEVEYGERLGFLQKIAEREGRLPPALASRPTPESHALPYLAAFKRLHSSRMIRPDGSPCGIAMSEIESYSRMFGFDSFDDRLDLAHFVRVCDAVWMAEMKKRRD
jgi:hypothetical protein